VSYGEEHRRWRASDDHQRRPTLDNGDAAMQPAQSAGHGAADFEVFYRARYRELVKAAMYAGATQHEAEDATDASMEDVLRHWASIEYPVAYARKALGSNLKKLKTRNLDRTRRRQIECGAAVGKDQEDARLSAWEEVQWTRQLLESLPPAQRDVMAFVVDGLKPGEIAELLGITPGATRQRILAARQQLKLALQAERGPSSSTSRPASPAKEVTE
jgi:RNA polymerase sigma factor (sigma-70 family)